MNSEEKKKYLKRLSIITIIYAIVLVCGSIVLHDSAYIDGHEEGFKKGKEYVLSGQYKSNDDKRVTNISED